LLSRAILGSGYAGGLLGIIALPHHPPQSISMILIARGTVYCERIVLAGIGYVTCVFIELTKECMGGGTVRNGFQSLLC
jgi:hypothetical protein